MSDVLWHNHTSGHLVFLPLSFEPDCQRRWLRRLRLIPYGDGMKVMGVGATRRQAQLPAPDLGQFGRNGMQLWPAKGCLERGAASRELATLLPATLGPLG